MAYDRNSDKKAEIEKKNWNVVTDEELVKVMGEKFFSFKSILEKMTTDTVLTRLLNIARDLEKSERIINTIMQRLAEVQLTTVK
jgi:hypothetical protein